jgi:hypothetical protein
MASTDPVSSLTDDHVQVRELADQLEKATESGDAEAASELAHELTKTLNAHTAVEEEVFYPAVLDVAPDLAPKVEEVLGDHQAAKALLFEAATNQTKSDESTRPEMQETRLLIEAVHRHTTEEDALFDSLRATARDAEVARVAGDEVDAKKQSFNVVRSDPDGRAPSGRKAARRAAGAAAAADIASDSEDAAVRHVRSI